MDPKCYHLFHPERCPGTRRSAAEARLILGGRAGLAAGAFRVLAGARGHGSPVARNARPALRVTTGDGVVSTMGKVDELREAYVTSYNAARNPEAKATDAVLDEAKVAGALLNEIDKAHAYIGPELIIVQGETVPAPSTRVFQREHEGDTLDFLVSADGSVSIALAFGIAIPSSALRRGPPVSPPVSKRAVVRVPVTFTATPRGADLVVTASVAGQDMGSASAERLFEALKAALEALAKTSPLT